MKYIKLLLIKENKPHEIMSEYDPLNPANLNATAGYRIIMKDGSMKDYNVGSRIEALRQAREEGEEPLDEEIS